MGKVVLDARYVGSLSEGVEGFIHSVHSGGPALWGGDLGLNAADGEGPGQFPFQDCKEDHRETTAEKEVRELGITNTGEDT